MLKIKYFSGELNTIDGEKLKIILPTKIEIIKKYKKHSSILINDEKYHYIKNYLIVNNLKDSIKNLQNSLKASIKWIKNERNAPPANHKIYLTKCFKSYNDLEKLYKQKFPELFI